MFIRRIAMVFGAIVGGSLLATRLIFGPMDGDRGGWHRAAVAPPPRVTAGGADPSLAAHGGKQGPFPPMVDIPVVAAGDTAARVRDGDYVVGVEIDGEARAYPLNMLSRPDRHVLNDTLAGRPIAVTWCGLCQSPIVYDRRAAGRTLVFFVPGDVFGENMALEDVETGSRWAQILGEARTGPLEGKTLEPIPSVWTEWKTWQAEHPETTVLDLAPTIEYHRRAIATDEPAVAFERRYLSSLQWGLARGGRSISWPFRELMRQPVVNDVLGDLPLLIVYDDRGGTVAAFDRRVGDAVPSFRLVPDGLADDRTGSVWDPLTGRAVRGPLAGRRLTPVAGVISHLRAWQTFHPDSESRVAGSDGAAP